MDDLSKLSGISKNTIYTIENDRGKDVGVETIRNLSKALNVKPYELIGDGPDPITIQDIVSYLNDTRLSEDETVLVDNFRELGRLTKLWILAFVSDEQRYRDEFDELLKVVPFDEREAFLNRVSGREKKD